MIEKGDLHSLIHYILYDHPNALSNSCQGLGVLLTELHGLEYELNANTLHSSLFEERQETLVMCKGCSLLYNLNDAKCLALGRNIEIIMLCETVADLKVRLTSEKFGI